MFRNITKSIIYEWMCNMSRVCVCVWWIWVVLVLFNHHLYIGIFSSFNNISLIMFIIIIFRATLVSGTWYTSSFRIIAFLFTIYVYNTYVFCILTCPYPYMSYNCVYFCMYVCIYVWVHVRVLNACANSVNKVNANRFALRALIISVIDFLINI